MIEKEINRKISDFRSIGLPHFVPREGDLHWVQSSVSTLIGARRAGKSFRAIQEVEALIRSGQIASLKNVCLLDFDNPVLSQMSAVEVKDIPGLFLKLSPDLTLKTPLLFIFDEIHKIPGWEEAVLDISRNPNWKVLVTGSSSKLLKDDLATEMRGKSVSSVIYPLSFSEFLRFRSFDGTPSSTEGEAAIRRHFDDYLKWGGYPAVTLTTEASKEVLLREYFDTMILRDIIQRYNVNNPAACTQLCNYLISNMARPTSHLSATKHLQETGHATSRNRVRDTIRWASDSWFIFWVTVFSKSRKDQERNYKKVYCIDWAMACTNSTVWDGSLSRSFENMIFLHLNRKFSKVHYYLTKTKRQELDFVALGRNGRPEILAQACLDISQPETLKRELEPLVATAKYLNTTENYILTLNQERVFHEEGVTVSALPAWKWMLGK